MSLRLDWATHEAAKYACENWHYSKCLPFGGLVKVGVWENDNFIGVVLFSHGTAKDLGKAYGLTQFEAVELTRVALNKHINPVTKIIRVAIKMLKKQSPKIKLIVSFADREKGHIGSIYQGGNWVYTGDVSAKHIIFYRGKEIPLRTYFENYKKNRCFKDKCEFRTRSPKFRYLMPLDKEIAFKIEKLRRPYPKRVGSKDNVASGFQSGEGGATPTPTLQTT